ncbi:efflux RND transporter periplasmic adaptor subunit [Falsiroseomonas sp. HW251]|uniref:efflux RND transporter periplasmic adaptor subunit n=1 Tax=Falsiroseomonas sp. HW251 TaxID=3390998 RepID=UPI003D30F140
MLRAALAALLLLTVSSAGPALAQPGPQGPPAVGVITAQRQPVTESTEFIGRVEAIDRVDLRARITGFVNERLFREGQEVTQGQPLYRLERAPVEADLARAQAQVASAEASLTNANINLERARDLVRTAAGTQARVDDATAQQRTAQAQLLAAQAQARVAQINLGYVDIAAPFAGKIGRSNFSPGAVVGPDSGPLATIVSQDPMRVAFPVSLRAGLELRDRFAERGGVQAVQVRIRLANNQVFSETGRIEFIDTSVSRDTDTLLVRARISNPPLPVAGGTGDPERQLIDGMFVNVFVEGVSPVQAVVIPRAAVLQDQQGNYVFLVGAQNRAERRGVNLGRTIGDQVVIEGGLQGGETLITEGVQRVRPGQPVNPAPAAPPAVREGAPQAPRG